MRNEDDEIVQRKSKKKKHKEKEAISTLQVNTEKKKKLKDSKEKEALSSSTENKRHKESKEKESTSSSEVPAEKRKHKKRKEKEAVSCSDVPTDAGSEKKGKESREKESVSDTNGKELIGKRKRKKDKEKVTGCSELECTSDHAALKGKDPIDVGSEENVEHMKKGKGKKDARKNENGGESGESCTAKSGGEAQSGSRSSRKRDREEEVLDVAMEGKNKKKKKKTKLDANVENSEVSIGDVDMQNNLESTDESLRNSDSKKSSNQVEVFPSSDDKDDQEEIPGKNLIQGRRVFTEEEDQLIKAAVYSYIEAHKLGEEGLDMILHTSIHPSVRGCWKEIGAAITDRPFEAVHRRAHYLLEEENTGKKLIQGRRFTKEEDQLVKAAVYSYIEAHKLGEEGIDMILHCSRHSSIRDCWKEIGAAIPHRHFRAVYRRAHYLFERNEYDREDNTGKKLFRVMRCTKKDDQLIKDAVYNYIEAHELGEEGLDMVLHCSRHPSIKDCWKEIGAALHRPRRAVYSRAHTLFAINDGEESSGKKLIQGKRFTKEEDQMVKDAVYSYIEARQLGEKGLDMILHCMEHQSVRNCWKEIGTALPWRPTNSVYERAHILFERAESHKWTEDEKAFILKFVKKHGPDWKRLAEVLGKSRRHTKDIYRRLSREGLKSGRWTQAEYQSLFHLVNKDLRMRVFEEKFSKYGMLRDNISWTAISQRLATRAQDGCCMKWYNQLTSSLVREKKWADADDYRLLDELYKLDACCIEDVDWDNLLEHRPGDITLKRWRQMVNHIGEHGLQSFAEQVELLAKRYCPELLEFKEAFDSKPFVDC